MSLITQQTNKKKYLLLINNQYMMRSIIDPIILYMM